MAINPGSVGLALVDSGWTGDVQVSRGATTETITPPTRTSAAALWADVVRAAQNKFGGTWQGWPDADDKLHITTTLPSFNLVCSGTTQTRLGFTSTYTGAAEYTAASAHYGGTYPTRGMRVDAGMPGRTTLPAAASGDYGGSGHRRAVVGSLVCYGTYSELVTLEAALDAGETHDAWIAGRVVSRGRIGEVQRRRWGRLTGEATVDAGWAVVSL